MNETVLIDCALMTINLSKLVDDEEPLFLSFLSDVFGSKPNQKPDETVKNALIANIISHNLGPFQEWVTKTIQLQETYEVRYQKPNFSFAEIFFIELMNLSLFLRVLITTSSFEYLSRC